MTNALRAPARAELERIVAEANASPSRQFAAWLAERMLAAGRTFGAVASDVGLPIGTITRILKHPTAVPAERNVRLLATSFGGDPDVWAAQLGYSDVRAPAPSPRSYSTIGEWLQAALDTRHETASHAAIGAGLSEPMVRLLISSSNSKSPERPTLDKLADYFTVDRAELRAMRPKMEGKVAAGKALYESRTPEQRREHMRRVRLLQTPEQKRAAGHLAGVTNARRRRPEQWRAMQANAVEARKATGSWFASEDTRAQARAAIRASGGPSRGGRATVERHGVEHMHRASAISAERSRNGKPIPCVFCGCKRHLIYQTPSNAVRGRKLYHGGCWKAWWKTLPVRERAHAWGTVGWIWSQVKLSSDEALKKQVRAQMDAEVALLRNPLRRGRRPLLLARKDAAVWAAIMHVEYGVTAREIGTWAGFSSTTKPSRHGEYDYDIASSSAWDLIRYGRALLRL